MGSGLMETGKENTFNLVDYIFSSKVIWQQDFIQTFKNISGWYGQNSEPCLNEVMFVLLWKTAAMASN